MGFVFGGCLMGVGGCGQRGLWRDTDRQSDRQTDTDTDRGVCVHVKGELVRREAPSNWLMQI